MPDPVCVRHRDGWCATRRMILPSGAVTRQRTACERTVILPTRYERRQPTCRACRVRLKEVSNEV